MKIYIDKRDLWVGYYRGGMHHYVCPLPTVVIRWLRVKPEPVRFVRRPDPPAEAQAQPQKRRHARVTEAHLSQPRTFWRNSDSPVDD